VGLPADRGRRRCGRWLLPCTHLSHVFPVCWAIPQWQAPLAHSQGDCAGRPVCRGEVAGGAGLRGLSPGQQTHCAVVGLRVEECFPAMLTVDFKDHMLVPNRAEQCFHGQHCKPACRAKPRSRWERRPQLQGYGPDGRTGMGHLLGLVGRRSSSWHSLQHVSDSSGICSVLRNTWKSRARKSWWKCTFKLSGQQGILRMSCSTLVACRKQNTRRCGSVPRHPRGRA